ncbi:hypothetical protein LPC08_08085 [Roseomonas sp. OT10]|uniref:hypothetical protein n=1 Tax=Roseomonas cutis TaxID=2897332 RepID=UPI001E59B6EC|nr:hypothetical protein [Roseomonas sp. OT10]UFN50563.1 hypothetical protein LPC08_08085 [Roseomonas sp. OT10]
MSTMGSGQGGVTVVQAAPARLDREGLAGLGIPFLLPLIEHLHALQARPSERTGRWFQRDLIGQGFFEVPSAWTGEPVRTRQSVLLRDKSVVYLFDGEPDLWLGAGSLGDGCPVNSVFIPSRRLFLNLGHEVWGARPEQVLGAERILAAMGHAPPAGDGARVTVVSGDPSFAHHVWNQLGALDRLAAEGWRDRRLDLVVTHEPLGPIRGLFADCQGWTVTHCFEHALEELNAPGRLFVPLGGALVTRGARERLFRHVAALPGTAPLPRHPRGWRFWISIRTRNRTAANQIEFLTALCQALGAAYPGCEVILDGHSLAEDNDRLMALGDRSNLAIAAADLAVADAVAAGLRRRRRVRVTKAVGLRISQSLTLARGCDFYVCHHGTVQHKIGWFTDVPGIAHSNREITLADPAPSVAGHVEGGVAPVYLPERLIGELGPRVEGDALAAELRHDGYVVTALEEACAFIVAEAGRHVPPAPPGLWQRLRGRLRRLGRVPP